MFHSLLENFLCGCFPLKLQKSAPYDVYQQLIFDVPIDTGGDCNDCYRICIEEM
jgi:NADH:ubiquinone oxidoreductase subunit D